MTGQGGWIQGQGEGHLILAGQDDKHLSPSRTDKDSGRSFKGDKVDSSAWSFFSGAGQKGSKDSTVDGSPDSDKSKGGGSRDRGGTALTTKVSYGEGRTTSSGEGSMEAGEGLSPGGGGAFMLFRRDPTKQTSTTTQLTMGGTGEYKSRRREFEAWLSKENELLSGICSTKGATLSAKELKIRQETLKALRSRLAWGQEQFQLLLQESQSSEAGSGPAEDVSLEELRYRWMLYKSKLKDVGDIRARASAKRVQAKQEEPAIAAKVQKKPGLLQRVCRLALPLWLLLLALLLLAFLLPLMDESSSCSLSNNFARSFNVMLRYDGPPPT